MADDGALSKLKEQYVDDILTIVPLSQAFFIILMVVVSDQIRLGKANSTLVALTDLGLKSTLGPEAGRFWGAGVLTICIAFGLALLNTFVLRKMLARSLRLARVGASLVTWQAAAVQRVVGLNDDQKKVIHGSLKPEIDERLKKFKGKRIATELVASVVSLMIYSNVYIVIKAWKSDHSLAWEASSVCFFFVSLIVCILMHRESLRYAISKILPLKVYAGVLTGELVFFEEISN